MKDLQKASDLASADLKALGPGILKVIKWIRSKELQMPAVLMLEMHRPLMPLAWTGAMLVGPFIAPLLGSNYYQNIEALKDPQYIDRIIARLEEPINE